MVTDLAASLRFWCGPCGFGVLWERPEEGFACLERPEGARVMLEQEVVPGRRRWVTGPLERPLGRGMNLEVRVAAVGPIRAALAAEGWPLFAPVEEVWYRVGAREVGVRQFLVQDPDGYLLRFQESLGTRPAAA